eukprot:TRINITY_DN26953_c0_g1_i1.p1 TRINITY_DN26953_c0_g1~~TRINITY_DN26953_c0_g1_i1.p1  ORF type:complete len:601 (-),score=123.69 TRINITY_DN26953_c0_g1_i1:73-1875(-)
MKTGSSPTPRKQVLPSLGQLSGRASPHQHGPLPGLSANLAEGGVSIPPGTGSLVFGAMSSQQMSQAEYFRKRQDPRNEGLEYCKQAMSGIVGDIRSEVHIAINAIASDLTASQRMSPITQRLQAAEEEALSRTKALLSLSNWELGERLDQQLQWNENVGDNINESIMNSENRILQVLDRLENKTQMIEDRLIRSEDNLTREIAATRKSLQNSVESSRSNILSEIAKTQDQENSHYNHLSADLESQRGHLKDNFSDIYQRFEAASSNVDYLCNKISDQLVQVKGQLERQLGQSEAMNGAQVDVIKGTHDHLEQVLLRIQSTAKHSEAQLVEVLSKASNLQDTTTHISKQVKDFQQQDQQQYTDFRLSFETHSAEERVQLHGLKAVLDGMMDPMLDGLSKTRRSMDKDMQEVLVEVSRVQQALNIHYKVYDTSEKTPPELADADQDELGPLPREVRDFMSQTEEADFPKEDDKPEEIPQQRALLANAFGKKRPPGKLAAMAWMAAKPGENAPQGRASSVAEGVTPPASSSGAGFGLFSGGGALRASTVQAAANSSSSNAEGAATPSTAQAGGDGAPGSSSDAPARPRLAGLAGRALAARQET